MKGLKCTHYWGYLSGVLLGLLFLIYAPKTANAIQLTDGTTRRATNTSYLKMTDGSTRQTFNATYGLADTDFQNLPANYYVDNIRLNLSDYLPANTIFTFTMYYRVQGSSTYTAGIEYFGWSSGSSWTLLDDSCVTPESSLVTNTQTWETTLTCTYTGFTNVRLDYIDNVDRTRLVRFLNADSSQGWVNHNAQITIGYIDSRTISWNGLTQDDRDWLEQVLEDTGADVSSVVSAVNSQTSTLNSSINNLRNDVQSQTEQQHEDYENEVEREEAKQEELEDQADDLSISAQNPGNPFANLFQTQGCVSMPVFSSWFHRSDVIQVCSPYPADVRPIIEFVSSVIVVGFLIKIYFKLFKGGYAS